MEAVARGILVTARYNGQAMTVAPHALFARHGELFLRALNLSKTWRTAEDRHLGQFKLDGLDEVAVTEEPFEPLPNSGSFLANRKPVPVEYLYPRSIHRLRRSDARLTQAPEYLRNSVATGRRAAHLAGSPGCGGRLGKEPSRLLTEGRVPLQVNEKLGNLSVALNDEVVRPQAAELTADLIESVTIYPGARPEAEVSANITDLIRFAANENGPEWAVRKDCSIMVVAGVGFEPTTFRL